MQKCSDAVMHYKYLQFVGFSETQAAPTPLHRRNITMVQKSYTNIDKRPIFGTSSKLTMTITSSAICPVDNAHDLANRGTVQNTTSGSSSVSTHYGGTEPGRLYLYLGFGLTTVWQYFKIHSTPTIYLPHRTHYIWSKGLCLWSC